MVRLLILVFLLYYSSLSMATEKAVAVLQPTQGSEVTGVVTFEQNGAYVNVTVQVSGLKPFQKHGFHVHEFGDIRALDGSSAGGHYNPAGHPHALPPTQTRHAGSFGNLQADKNGEVDIQFRDRTISVSGKFHPIIGRSLIIHAKPDDGGQPTGNAGPRIAMAVIGIAK